MSASEICWTTQPLPICVICFNRGHFHGRRCCDRCSLYSLSNVSILSTIIYSIENHPVDNAETNILLHFFYFYFSRILKLGNNARNLGVTVVHAMDNYSNADALSISLSLITVSAASSLLLVLAFSSAVSKFFHCPKYPH